MSITDELREWVRDGKGSLLAIADRIDAEHERQLGVLYRDMSDAEWVRLPFDADGVPIHIGDVMDSKVDYLFDGRPLEVRALVLCEDGWEAADGRFGNRYEPDSLRHHHAPTVEDVLTEIAAKLIERSGLTNGAAQTISEYAAKLQLKEEA